MISLNSMLGMLAVDLALGKPKQHRYLPHEAFSEPKSDKNDAYFDRELF